MHLRAAAYTLRHIYDANTEVAVPVSSASNVARNAVDRPFSNSDYERNRFIHSDNHKEGFGIGLLFLLLGTGGWNWY